MEPLIMELEVAPGRIAFRKRLNELDELALSFCSILEGIQWNYVVVSGYVAIAFARSRSSDDIDILIEEATRDRVARLWTAVREKFGCMQTSSFGVAYDDYLAQGSAVRFIVGDEPTPNVEVKFARTAEHLRSLASPLEVVINGRPFRTSSLESQIAHKIKLGSEKDYEDARYLYKLMRKHLDERKILSEATFLGVDIPTLKDEIGMGEP